MKTKILKIITHPNPILRKVSVPVNIHQIDKKTKQLIDSMKVILAKLNGAGLAAPQIGKNIRLVLVSVKGGPLIMLNPKITQKSIEKEIGEEGCFSVVNDNNEIVFNNVSRYKKIECEYYNQEGVKKEVKAEGLLARVIQHEIDHLDGILFIDRII